MDQTVLEEVAALTAALVAMVVLTLFGRIFAILLMARVQAVVVVVTQFQTEVLQEAPALGVVAH
jgi:hypothetical protein